MIVLALPVLGAAAAYGCQVTRGLGVTGLNDQYFWGLYETNLVTFIALSYGGALVSAILRIAGAQWRAPITRMAETTAFVTLLVGAVFAVIHLGRPERSWEFFTRPQFGSPIVWDFIAINTYLVATTIFLYLALIPDLATCAQELGDRGGWRRKLYERLSLGWRGAPHQRSVLARAETVMTFLIIPIAVTVHSVLAWAFSVHVRPGWHSSIFGPYFVVGAIYSGVAAVVLVVSAFRKAYKLEAYIEPKHFTYFGYMIGALALAYAYFTFSDLLTESYVMDEGAEHLLTMLLVSTYGRMFWTFIGLGIVVPALLVAWRRTRTVAGITTAAALVVAMMWMKRFLIIVPTLGVQQIIQTAHRPPYVPSLVEIAISLGALAAVPLLLMLFFRIFPLLSVNEMEDALADHSAARAASRGGAQ
jgi:molybdopterin-containing oxidoreductase family membrane subunit